MLIYLVCYLYIFSNFKLIFVSSLFFIFMHYFYFFMCFFFCSLCKIFEAGEMQEPRAKHKNFATPAKFRNPTIAVCTEALQEEDKLGTV